MKKSWYSGFVGVLIICLFLCACTIGGDLAEAFDEETVSAEAKAAVSLVNDLDYAALEENVAPVCKEALSAEVLKGALDTRVKEAGAFEEYDTVSIVGTKDRSSGADYAVAVMICRYENSRITYTISFDTEMHIAGFYVK